MSPAAPREACLMELHAQGRRQSCRPAGREQSDDGQPLSPAGTSHWLEELRRERRGVQLMHLCESPSQDTEMGREATCKMGVIKAHT